MNRLTGLICGIALLVCTSTALAQHQGQQGGAGRSSGKSNSDDLRDFKRALALQAYPDQASQFKQLATSTQAARKATQELLQLSANANNHDFAHSTEAVSSAVEEAQADNDKFVSTFTKVQKSELKNLTKKLEKAKSEMSKESKALGPAASDAKQIAGVAERLDKALSDFATALDGFASEMGIQKDVPPQSQ
jgi:predicted trehalose synthase